MINIHQKTLQDLEFYTVLQQVSEHCVTALGRESALQILPFKNREKLLNGLHLTNEYLSSFYNDNRIPNHGFDTISKELKLIRIENTYLEVHSLKKLVSISLTANEIISFLKKFEDLNTRISGAIREYSSEVRAETFPAESHSLKHFRVVSDETA